jgi:peptidoglycan/LPS O-acetylase OafA/YrhL
MTKQRILAWVIGVSQLALGAAFLLVPNGFFSLFGFTEAQPDQNYLYGQLAARFLAYGIGMFVIARDPRGNRVWWMLMGLIQAVDLAVGLYYTLFANVALSSSAFPMVNAAVFLVLLLLWAPAKAEGSSFADTGKGSR